ncbi:MAG: hypothetical protein AB2A00_26825 [Myxococcota bacterium]
MISLTATDVSRAGGFLAALSAKSLDYLGRIHRLTCDSQVERRILRHVVHTDPHLDEYCAEALFSSSMNAATRESIDFIEASIYSQTSDLGAQKLWPDAAVFGIGASIACGATPVLLFDEHAAGGGRYSPSCTSAVADFLVRPNGASVPPSFAQVFREVSAIDSFGRAHQQHIGNIIKTMHNARFLLKKGIQPKDDIRDTLTPYWKRAVIQACLAAVVWALEEHLDIVRDSTSASAATKASMRRYFQASLHRGARGFDEAMHRIQSLYGDQAKVFQQASLPAPGGGAQRDASGNEIPQLMVLGRVCRALNEAWGPMVADAVMMHFWEVELQRELNFRAFAAALDSLPAGADQPGHTASELGRVRKEVIKGVRWQEQSRHRSSSKVEHTVWVLSVTPRSGVFNAHQVALNFINTKNNGLGLVLLEDGVLGTKTVFRAQSIPEPIWRSVMDELLGREPGCWYDASSGKGVSAPFLSNGNKAHQYVPRSGIDCQALASVVARASA